MERRKRPPLPLSPPTHRDEDPLTVFAATVSFEHTLVITQHITGLTDAALLAGGGDFVARALTAAVWVQAGRWTGGKAVCVVTVSWALQSYGSEETGISYKGQTGPKEAKAAETRVGSATGTCLLSY